MQPMWATLWGGIGLAVTGLLTLLGTLGAGVALQTGATVWFGEQPFDLVAGVVLLASALVLAFGAPGEHGIVGRSAVGRVALIGFGLALLWWYPLELLPGAAWVGVVALAVQVVLVVAALVAAVAVVRARRVSGYARWSLLPVAIAAALLFLVQLSLATLPAAFVLEPLHDLLLAAAGAGFALSGRTAAIRSRLRRVQQEW